MLFSSITFLYGFLPLTLAAYFLAPKGARNAVLLVASLLFYFLGEPVCLLLLLFSSVSSYLLALGMERCRGTRRAKGLLAAAIVLPLALLGYFKYADFLIQTVNTLLHTAIPLTGVSLPIGISFFTFQTMAYTIDVYRGHLPAQKNPATLTTFVALFPQLVAGPIVRYGDLAAELEERRSTLEGVARGIRRFAIGLGKKVLLANALGELCRAFRSSQDLSVLFYWLYALAFCLQIYFDFSGYSDMAIGLGRMFGFSFPENFNYPYSSRSVTEFWRRWHMTLGSWFRDYVYIPLGGNRAGTLKWIRNLAVVWLLTGLWHGASWNFVLWGAYFGLILMLEKWWLGKLLKRAGPLAAHLYTMFLIVISFVIFNAQDLTGVLADLSGLFGGGNLPLVSFEALYQLKSYGLLLLAGVVGATPLCKAAYEKAMATTKGARVSGVLEPLAVTALLLCATAYLVDGSFNPFLYFRF